MSGSSRCSDQDAIYVGEIGGGAKLDLLGGAAALINPIRWPEPFGLVMIEALACGTPVLSLAEGAAPEIIEHGRTGYLCADEEDMATRLGFVAELDRAGAPRQRSSEVLDRTHGERPHDPVPQPRSRMVGRPRPGSPRRRDAPVVDRPGPRGYGASL